MNESTEPDQERMLSTIDRGSIRAKVQMPLANCSREDLKEVIGRNVMAWIGAETDEDCGLRLPVAGSRVWPLQCVGGHDDGFDGKMPTA